MPLIAVKAGVSGFSAVSYIIATNVFISLHYCPQRAAHLN